MLGSVLIVGGDKKERLAWAWKTLREYGFDAGKTVADLLVVAKGDDRKSIGVAQAREIKDFLRQKPFEKKIKAILVEDAQALTDEAQNSLLKVLEEPPSFALIILLVDKEGSLLPTVVSRCQRFFLTPDPTRKIGKNLFAEPETKSKDAAPKKPIDPRLRRSLDSPYNLWTKSPEELFDLAKSLSDKGKEETLEFLEQVLRRDLELNSPKTLVIKMESALRELKEANVALKFSLEYLFLLHVANRR